MCSTMVNGGWRLAVGGGWRLAVGNWWLVAVGGGWRRLVVGDWWLVIGGWWLVAVGSGWQLAVGRRWRLAAVGGWRLVAVGSWWRLAVGGPLGRSLRAVLSKKKKILSLKDRPVNRHLFCASSPLSGAQSTLTGPHRFPLAEFSRLPPAPTKPIVS